MTDKEFLLLLPQMDVECVLLCRAINHMPGVETTESCCGHGERPFTVWLKAARLRDLAVLARAIDRRYGGPSTQMPLWNDWILSVEASDFPEKGVSLLLFSRMMGKAAYEQADRIAENIEYWLRHPAFMALYVTPYLPVSQSTEEINET